MKTRTKKIWLAVVLLIGILGGIIFGYLSDAYQPNEKALAALESTSKVTVMAQTSYDVFLPKDPIKEIGLIFYQGGKVEERAYAPLLHQLAERGITSYLVHMPFNLAVFDNQAAGKVIENEPSVTKWYLAGHSLGGAMASSFAEKNPKALRGLILLAAYPAVDLTHTDLLTLSIYGDQDNVLSHQKYEESLALLPHVQEIVLKGGNHAQFGSYGTQKGDGSPTLSAAEQQKQTVDAIVTFINMSQPPQTK